MCQEITDDKETPRPTKQKRHVRRIAFVACILLAMLAILLPTFNLLWCRHQIPADFSGYDASGTFSSDQYPLVSGRLFMLPIGRELQCGEAVELQVLIYYNLWSPYRPGQIVRATVLCSIFDNRFNGCNFGGPSSYPNTRKFIFRDKNPGEPLISVVGMPSPEFYGVYRTAEPEDYGHFILLAR